MQQTHLKSLIILFVIVSISAFVSWAGGQNGAQINGYSVFFLCGLTAFAINWLAFVPSNIAKTEKFYDLIGSVSYVSVIFLAVIFSAEMDMRSQFAAAMVVIWAVRLGSFLFIRIRQDGHDSRFDDIKVQPLRFFNTWSIQALWVLLTAACALAIITSNNGQPLGMFGLLGISVWLFGFSIQVIADRQKRAFRNNPENKGQFINVGLWSWSRHPNYFGEITLWLGMAILALPILQGWQYVCLISPLFVFLLLTKVSGIPLLQKKGLEKWGDDQDYKAYLENTSMLIPLPPKNR